MLAVPGTGHRRIADFESKAAYQRRGRPKPNPAATSSGGVIEQGRIVELTREDGLRTGGWPGTFPEGKWTILRLGHTSTGMVNAPAPASGRGLECDKLSPEGIEANFAGMMAKLDRGQRHGGRQGARGDAHR